MLPIRQVSTFSYSFVFARQLTGVYLKFMFVI